MMTKKINLIDRNPVAPVAKANRLAVTNLEKLVTAQSSALQGYVDLGLERIKAAAEVTDVRSWQAFLNGQVETAKVLHRMLVNDGNVLAKLIGSFVAELDNLVKDSAAASASKVAKQAA